MTDDHGDSQGAEMLHRLAVVHIRTGDCHPRSVEHLSQGGHGHAADAHQMSMGTGADICMDVRLHSDTPHHQNSRDLMYHNDGFLPPVPIRAAGINWFRAFSRLYYSTPGAGEQEQNRPLSVFPLGQPLRPPGRKKARCFHRAFFQRGEIQSEKVKSVMI